MEYPPTWTTYCNRNASNVLLEVETLSMLIQEPNDIFVGADKMLVEWYSESGIISRGEWVEIGGFTPRRYRRLVGLAGVGNPVYVYQWLMQIQWA